MNRKLLCVPALSLALLLAARAQAPAAQNPSASNPFPEDTSTVPVLPTAAANGAAPDHAAPSLAPAIDDNDPVKSPDDAESKIDTLSPGESSSSLKGMENLLPQPDDDTDQRGRHRKLTAPEPVHHEGPKEDISVGGYYLEKKNWRAALSRFQSAMVLDPENPEVYWGLAEAERHLGDAARARADYLKLLDYDPDGPHGKQARKILADPAFVSALQAAPPPTAPPAK